MLSSSITASSNDRRSSSSLNVMPFLAAVIYPNALRTKTSPWSLSSLAKATVATLGTTKKLSQHCSVLKAASELIVLVLVLPLDSASKFEVFWRGVTSPASSLM